MNTKQLAREREALLQLYYQSNNSLEKEYLCQKISLVEAQLEDLEDLAKFRHLFRNW